MKRAIIIGNGFDLALESKTSFKDFLESEEYRQIPRNNSLKIYCEEQLKSNERWSDLEGGLITWADEQVHKSKGFKGGRLDLPVIRQEFYEFALTIQHYIGRASLSFKNVGVIRIDALLDDWLRSEVIDVLNFNYTNMFSSYLGRFTESRLNSPKIIHQHFHGSLAESNTVFGTGEICPEGFEFMSKQVNVEKPVSITATLVDADELVFFGHSFGSSDFDQIEFIFRYLDLEEHGIDKVRCYTKDKNSAKEVKENILRMARKNLNRDIIADWNRTGKPFDVIPMEV